MAYEKIVLKFQKDDKFLVHTWTIKKGIRGSRDAKKVRKLQEKWGDPYEIIGSGSVAKLLRKEYKLYNADKKNYSGISSRDLLGLGTDISGFSASKLKASMGNIRKRLRLSR